MNLIPISENRKYFLNYPKAISKNELKLIKQNHRKNYSSLFHYFLLIFVLIPLVFNLPIKTKDIGHNLSQLYLYQITIKIKGKGEQRIINEKYDLCPDIVYLNNGGTNIVGSDCLLVNIPSSNADINTLKLIWNTETTDL